MPKVCINYKQYKIENIGAWIVSRLFKERKRYEDLANALDTSRQNVYYKIHHNRFTYGDLLTIFEFFGCSDEEILQVMRLRADEQKKQ